jgi:hypothetical protein
MTRTDDEPANLKISARVDTESAVQAAIEVYGTAAKTAVAHCALEAHFDGRGEDYRFRCAVFRELDEGTQ